MKPNLIFFGNGPLADFTLEVLRPTVNLLFHAKTKDDLKTVKALKAQHPDAFGVLASFGVLIKPDLLDLFEPEGILNLHPSLLPQYRGASPIESAILAGDTSFSVSIMKLAPAMDAGPIYHQETIDHLIDSSRANPDDKLVIYEKLAKAGATWLVKNLPHLPTPTEQNNDLATYTQKLDKSMSRLEPGQDTAEQTLRKIIAYQGFPKPKYTLLGQDVIILSAHIEKTPPSPSKTLSIPCADGFYVVIDRLQPLSRKPMDAKSFLNGLRSSS